MLQTCKNQGLLGKGLKISGSNFGLFVRKILDLVLRTDKVSLHCDNMRWLCLFYFYFHVQEPFLANTVGNRNKLINAWQNLNQRLPAPKANTITPELKRILPNTVVRYCVKIRKHLSGSKDFQKKHSSCRMIAFQKILVLPFNFHSSIFRLIHNESQNRDFSPPILVDN